MCHSHIFLSAQQQPTVASISPPAPSATFTPKWSTVEQPKALFSDALICHIDDDGEPDKKAKEVEGSTEDKSGSGGGGGLSSKLKSKFSKVARTPSVDERSVSPTSTASSSTIQSLDSPRPSSASQQQQQPPVSLRGLQISNPILQSSVDIKAPLVPVCRASDVTPTSSGSTSSFHSVRSPPGSLTSPEVGTSPSKSKKAKAPPPPPQHQTAVVTVLNKGSAAPSLPDKPKDLPAKPKDLPSKPKDLPVKPKDLRLAKGKSKDESDGVKKPLFPPRSSVSKSSARPASIATTRCVRYNDF